MKDKNLVSDSQHRFMKDEVCLTTPGYLWWWYDWFSKTGVDSVNFDFSKILRTVFHGIFVKKPVRYRWPRSQKESLTVQDLFSLKRRRLSWDLYCWLTMLCFSHRDKSTGSRKKLQEWRFWWDVRKWLFTMRAVKHLNRGQQVCRIPILRNSQNSIRQSRK